MGNLILNSLEIRNFRGFEHLTIERLGRVNLITGRNNTGKSALLEALRLYARKGSPKLIKEMLEERDENGLFATARLPGPVLYPSKELFPGTVIESILPGFGYLFYGRKLTSSVPIQIGPLHSPDDMLSIQVSTQDLNTDSDFGSRLAINLGKQQVMNIGSAAMLAGLLNVEQAPYITSLFVPPNGLEREFIGRLWDGIVLTSQEKEVIASLRIIAPGIENVGIIGDPGSASGRIPIVKIAGVDDPMPLRSLGDGMQRIFGISLALVNAKDGMLLIDEFENGVHYSAQDELWQLIFQLAHRLNVQVFATTHSWDCIEGFQKAAQESKQDEGILIRLSLKGDEVISTIFDERKLAIATREQIEVR
jgi:ABC-type transport system involved in cytochrome c biogenesis ATPase subunit